MTIFKLVNYCYNHPCKNNGTCTLTSNGYNCSCALYYSGQTCLTCE